MNVVKLDKDNWQNSTCTCAKFQKEYICKHVVGNAAVNELYRIPDTANTDLIGRKRKKGRPRKIKMALIVASYFVNITVIMTDMIG